MFRSHRPTSMWFDAFSTIVHIICRLPSSILGNKSPFKLLFHTALSYSNFKPFGYRVYLYLRDYTRSHPCIFHGYSSSFKGFQCYDPSSSRIFITQHM